MHPRISALQTDLIALMASLIMAGDDTAALRLIREAQSRIEAALAAVEVRT